MSSRKNDPGRRGGGDDDDFYDDDEFYDDEEEDQPPARGGGKGGLPPLGRAPGFGGSRGGYDDEDEEDEEDSFPPPRGGLPGARPGTSPRPGGLPGSPGSGTRPGGLPGAPGRGGQPPAGRPAGGRREEDETRGGFGRQTGRSPFGGGRRGDDEEDDYPPPRGGGLPGARPGGTQPGRPAGLPGSPGSPARPGAPGRGTQPLGGRPGAGRRDDDEDDDQPPARGGGLPSARPGGTQPGRPAGLPGSPGSPARPGAPGRGNQPPGGRFGGGRDEDEEEDQPPARGGLPGARPGAPGSRPGGGPPGSPGRGSPGRPGTPGASGGRPGGALPSQPGRSPTQAGGRPGGPSRTQPEEQSGGGLLGGIRSRLPFGGGRGADEEETGRRGGGPPGIPGRGPMQAGGKPGAQESGGGLLGGIRSRLPFGGGGAADQEEDQPPARGGLPGARPGSSSPGRPGGPTPPGGPPGSSRPGGLSGGPAGRSPSQPGGGSPARPGGVQPPGGRPGQGSQPGGPQGGKPGSNLPGSISGSQRPGGAGQPSSPGARPAGGGLPGGIPPRPGSGTQPGTGRPGSPGGGSNLPGGVGAASRPGGGSPARPGGGKAPTSPSGLPGGIGAPSSRPGTGSPTKSPRVRGKAKPAAAQTDAVLSLDTKLDILGIVLILVALVTLLSFLSNEQGWVTDFWLKAIKQMFGWGGYVIPIPIAAVGIWLIWRHFGDQLPPVDPLRIIGVAVVFVTVLTLIHSVTVAMEPLGAVWYNPALTDPNTPGYTPTLVWDQAVPLCEGRGAANTDLASQGWRQQLVVLSNYQLAQCGWGGGYIGAFIRQGLGSLIGYLPVFFLMIVGLLGGLMLTFRMTLKDSMQLSKQGYEWANARRTAFAVRRNAQGELVAADEEDQKSVAAPSRANVPGAAAAPAAIPAAQPAVGAPSGAAASGGPAPSPVMPGRPSIVTGQGPAGAPAAPPSPAQPSPSSLPPAGGSAAPGPSVPGSGFTVPSRPGEPAKPGQQEETRDLAGSSAPPATAPRPGSPAGSPPMGGPRPGMPPKPTVEEDEDEDEEDEETSAPARLGGPPGTAQPGKGPGTPAGILAGARPASPSALDEEDEDELDEEDLEDEDEDDETPRASAGPQSGLPVRPATPGASAGGSAGTAPRPGSMPVPGSRPGMPASGGTPPPRPGGFPGTPGTPAASGIAGSTPPRPGAPPAGAPASGGLTPTTSGPAAGLAGRTFGPPPPSSLSGSRPVPKATPRPASDDEDDDEMDFDDLRNAPDPMKDAIDLDEEEEDDDDTPTDDIIKKLVDDEDESDDDTPPGNGIRPPQSAGNPGSSGPSLSGPRPGGLPGQGTGSPPRPGLPGSSVPAGGLTGSARPDVPAPRPPSSTSSSDSGSPTTSSAAAIPAASPVAAPAAPRPGGPPTVQPSAQPAPSKVQIPGSNNPVTASAPTAFGPAKIESGSTKDQKPDWKLPAIEDMLTETPSKPMSDEELRRRAELIEQTLSSFGAPGRVVEVNQGPVITQFGVEPDYIDGRAGKRIKVKVGKISALSDDLALSLAAPSIRIEAPVPGKGFVGIEVPNAEASLVNLRSVMDTPEFRNMPEPLKLALGQDVSGQAVVADLAAMPHLLIAGTTGSGKSVCVNGIICTLLMTHTPELLKIIMVDPKRVELTNYNGIPHLMAPVVTELERIVGVLKWVQREMDERYRSFAMAGARNIQDYNNRVEKGQIKDGKKLPYLVVIVDELADLMMLAPDETERVITRLAQMARATGIHIILSTQRPSVDVVTGLIKANFPARIAFAVATGVDSRVILDQPGAEKLLGRGDMLFQAPDAPMPLRMQGVYLSDKEIQKIVDYWRAQASAVGYTGGQATLTFAGPGVGGPTGPRQSAESFSPRPATQRPIFEDGEDADGDGSDDMFDEAVELVRDMEKASISLLQRHLRIGYTRAARLIDLMEERGVIGPSTGGSKPRTVLGPDGKPLSEISDDDDDDDDL